MYGIIDVGGWQTYVDLKTGVEVPLEMPQRLCQLAENSVYPGDGEQSIGWVKQTAERVSDMYDPQWLMTVYTQPLFMESSKVEDKESFGLIHQRILEDIFAFCREKEYEPVIVMTGAKIPLIDEIRSLETTGLLESSPWGAALAGVSGAVPEDKEVLSAHPHIKAVISKEQIMAQHPGVGDNFSYYLPDYCLVAENGYLFRGFNSHFVHKKTLADLSTDKIPVFCSLGEPQHANELYGIMKNALLKGKRILFAVIEGYRADAGLPAGFQLLNNKEDWYNYGGLSQYLLFTSGRAYYEIPYPPVYNRSKKKISKDYPFSGFFISIPENTLGDLQGVRSAVVSSRSMIVHMSANADIALECYCRDKSNMGVMLTFKDKILNLMK